MNEKKTGGRKIFYRITAVILVIMLACVLILAGRVQVRLGNEIDTEKEQAVVDYLMENTEYINKNVFEKSQIYLKTIIMDAEAFEEYYALASVAISDGEYEDALDYTKMCQKLYTANDKDIIEDLWLKRGCLEAMLGEYDEALKSLGYVSKSNQSYRHIVLIAAQIYIEQNDLASARTNLSDYAEEHADDFEMKALLAEVCYLSGEFAEAEVIYSELIKTQGDEGGGKHLMAGLCKEQIDEYEEAIIYFEKAIELEYENLGICYEHIALNKYMTANYEDVLTYGNMASEAEYDNVNYAGLNNYMGLASMQQSEYQEAITFLDKALMLDSEMEDIYYYRGTSYMLEGEYEKAVDDFTKSIEAEIEMGLCYYNRAICNAILKNKDKALKDLEQVEKYIKDETMLTAAEEMKKSLQ